ncbi:MAG: hypothetical protein ACP5N2_04375 [Candidatus Nanoarchaeia archaeon]
MTTIIGIAGRDPDTLEDYVVLCADSLGTLSGKVISDNQKKIFADEKSNYALGVAGKCLSNYFSKNIDPALTYFLDDSKEEEKVTIEQRLGDINKNMLKEQHKENEFIVSLKEQKPMLYLFNGKELETAGSYCAIGSGINYLSNLKSIEKYINKGRVNLAKKETVDFIFEIMQKVATEDEGDEGTGGHMDLAIVTSSKIVHISNYAQLGSRYKDGISSGSSNNLAMDDNLHESKIHPYQREQD